jgi:hypothetical protein
MNLPAGWTIEVDRGIVGSFVEQLDFKGCERLIHRGIEARK